MSIIIFIIVGLVAGWLAGLIWKGRGFGAVGNLVVGVAGAFIGGFLLRLIGFHYGGIIASIVAAVIGALILLFLINLIKK
ncbi:MAG: GlsB/YeaQ/YmgE family stress response membrane protein [Spirochaetes bacterium]|nr:GlsB/YeaQ/YmgE family stress response membrane protein [Spirochaetota bacterium]